MSVREGAKELIRRHGWNAETIASDRSDRAMNDDVRIYYELMMNEISSILSCDRKLHQRLRPQDFKPQTSKPSKSLPACPPPSIKFPQADKDRLYRMYSDAFRLRQKEGKSHRYNVMIRKADEYRDDLYRRYPGGP